MCLVLSDVYCLIFLTNPMLLCNLMEDNKSYHISKPPTYVHVLASLVFILREVSYKGRITNTSRTN
jgi:hypothetical protein